jgi:hypothetical protein
MYFVLLDWLLICVSLYLILLGLERSLSKQIKSVRMDSFRWHYSWLISGLNLIKILKTSFRQHGYLVNSYESATMRRYQFGRVDNIRSATPEVHAWVSAMFDRTVSLPKKVRRSSLLVKNLFSASYSTMRRKNKL